MRRLVVAVPVLVTVVGGFATGVLVQAPGAAAAPGADAPTGKAVCTISDTHLDQISGMVAISGGYVVVNDGQSGKVYYLGSNCKPTKSVSLTSRDPQDLALAPNGTLWVADIGDDSSSGGSRRDNIAVWKIPKGSTKADIYHMSYPDGPHEAGAMLLSGDGTPIIVTKETSKPASIYTPTGALAAGKTVKMQKAGTFTPPKTATGNNLGVSGRTVVTGAASAPDGSRVVLRTLADAFEFDVTGGNVVDAITKGTPRATALAWEPNGQAITYTVDGKSFLTVSKTQEPKILQYTPATAPAKPPAKGSDADSASGSSGGQSWFDNLSLSEITSMVGGVGVFGALLVIVGVFGILRARKRPAKDGLGAGASDGDLLSESAARSGPISPVPGGVAAADSARGSSARGRQPSAAPARGGEYRSGGGEYRSGGGGGEYRSGGGEYRSGGGEYRSGGGEYRPGSGGGEYRSGASRRGTGGGEYRSGGRQQPPPPSRGGGAYGPPAQGSARPGGGGAVYGGGRSSGGDTPRGGSYQRGGPRQHDTSGEPDYDGYNYADRGPRY